MKTVVVREYARLTVASLQPSLDQATVSKSAFDWLVERSASFSRGGARLVSLDSHTWLRLDNFVGVVEAPDGTQIEILPKIIGDEQDAPRLRVILIRMICAAYDLPYRVFDDVSVRAGRTPLIEWLARRFLSEAHALIRKGLSMGYEEYADDLRCVRGRIDVVRQSRKGPHELDRISVRFDELTAQTRENSLLCAALDLLARSKSLSFDTLHQVEVLREKFSTVRPSLNVNDDLRRWRDDRLMRHYRPIRPLCELILRRLVPLTTAGEHRALSLLFPMERLFEEYVAKSLKQNSRPAGD